jgi:hypothetical protein
VNAVDPQLDILKKPVPDIQGDGEAIVTAHEVKGKVDYNKLCAQFGCSVIPESLVERIERITGVEAHPFLKRGVFYAHRDLDQLLDLYEQGKKFYLYTGATLRLVGECAGAQIVGGRAWACRGLKASCGCRPRAILGSIAPRPPDSVHVHKVAPGCVPVSTGRADDR